MSQQNEHMNTQINTYNIANNYWHIKIIAHCTLW